MPRTTNAVYLKNNNNAAQIHLFYHVHTLSAQQLVRQAS